MSYYNECSVENCNRPIRAKGFCHEHYQQDRYYGGIKRTKFDPNDAIMDGDLYLITLRDNFGNAVAITGIDSEDYAKVEKYKWRLLNNGYVASTSNGKCLLLHRLINNTPDNKLTDHKNGNTLDNRKCNLRNCDSSENGMNRKLNINNKAKLKGASFCKEVGKWVAHICFKKNQIRIGYFDSKIEAAKAYNNKALELYREFAKINGVQNEPL